MGRSVGRSVEICMQLQNYFVLLPADACTKDCRQEGCVRAVSPDRPTSLPPPPPPQFQFVDYFLHIHALHGATSRHISFALTTLNNQIYGSFSTRLTIECSSRNHGFFVAPSLIFELRTRPKDGQMDGRTGLQNLRHKTLCVIDYYNPG